MFAAATMTNPIPGLAPPASNVGSVRAEPSSSDNQAVRCNTLLPRLDRKHRAAKQRTEDDK
jgi:hypothetical protein